MNRSQNVSMHRPDQSATDLSVFLQRLAGQKMHQEIHLGAAEINAEIGAGQRAFPVGRQADVKPLAVGFAKRLRDSDWLCVCPGSL